jgi:hypothetical protein
VSTYAVSTLRKRLPLLHLAADLGIELDRDLNVPLEVWRADGPDPLHGPLLRLLEDLGSEGDPEALPARAIGVGVVDQLAAQWGDRAGDRLPHLLAYAHRQGLFAAAGGQEVEHRLGLGLPLVVLEIDQIDPVDG